MTAWSKTNEVSRKLVKVCGKVVKPHRTESVTEVLNIPHDLTPSFLNCSIIRLQYWLKVNGGRTLHGTCVSCFMFSHFRRWTDLFIKCWWCQNKVELIQLYSKENNWCVAVAKRKLNEKVQQVKQKTGMLKGPGRHFSSHLRGFFFLTSLVRFETICASPGELIS